MAREIPENYSWYKVSNPAILKGSCEVAALNEHMATTIAGKKYHTNIYVDDGRTTVNYLKPVSDETTFFQEEKSEEIPINHLRSEFNRCPNCGALIPPEQFRETQICPSCDEELYQVA